jgi:hypothetical protein
MHMNERIRERVAQLPRRATIGVGVAAITLIGAFVLAKPASAHDNGSSPRPTPAACTTPLTAGVCSPDVADNGGGAFAVTLPGVGTLNLTVDPSTGLITDATVSGLAANFTASAVKIDSDKDSAKVVITDTTTGQKYFIAAHESTANGTTTVRAFAGQRTPCNHDGSGDHNWGGEDRTTSFRSFGGSWGGTWSGHHR